VYLQKAQTTPYTGYLFTEDETKALRMELIDKDTLSRTNESYKTEVDLLQKSLTYRSEQVKILLDEQNTIETRKYLYVAGGVLATLLTIYAATKVVQATK
jgi:hypothetical protein